MRNRTRSGAGKTVSRSKNLGVLHEYRASLKRSIIYVDLLKLLARGVRSRRNPYGAAQPIRDSMRRTSCEVARA